MQAELDRGYIELKGKKKHYLTEDQKIARQNIINKMDSAQKAVDNKTNETVAKNVILDRGVQFTLAKDAASSAGHYALGNVIMFAIKPIYYELSDCINNGIEEGVQAESFAAALKIRLGRMKDHLWAHALPLLKDSMQGIFKNFFLNVNGRHSQLLCGCLQASNAAGEGGGQDLDECSPDLE